MALGRQGGAGRLADPAPWLVDSSALKLRVMGPRCGVPHSMGPTRGDGWWLYSWLVTLLRLAGYWLKVHDGRLLAPKEYTFCNGEMTYLPWVMFGCQVASSVCGQE